MGGQACTDRRTGVHRRPICQRGGVIQQCMDPCSPTKGRGACSSPNLGAGLHRLIWVFSRARLSKVLSVGVRLHRFVFSLSRLGMKKGLETACSAARVGGRSEAGQAGDGGAWLRVAEHHLPRRRLDPRRAGLPCGGRRGWPLQQRGCLPAPPAARASSVCASTHVLRHASQETDARVARTCIAGMRILLVAAK
jgi:hypothetical protein